jgi:hypothetical protein
MPVCRVATALKALWLLVTKGKKHGTRSRVVSAQMGGFHGVVRTAPFFNYHAVFIDGGCHVMAVREGEFDLLLLVWRCRFQIMVGVSLAVVVGVLLSFLFPPQFRAKAELIPLYRADAMVLLPATIPATTLNKASTAFEVTSEELFAQLGVVLSRIASERMTVQPESTLALNQFRIDQKNATGALSIDLQVHSADSEPALEELQGWIKEANQEVRLSLAEQFKSVLDHRIGDARWLLARAQDQEGYAMAARNMRLQDELAVVNSLLAESTSSASGPPLLLLQESTNESLLGLGLPPYLLNRSALQARARQVEQQLLSAQAKNAPGAYYEPVAIYQAGLESLLSIRKTYDGWLEELDERKLFHYSVAPHFESGSKLKQLILFVGSSAMLGLMLSLLWVFLRAAVQLAIQPEAGVKAR